EETPPEARILLVEDNVVNQRVATRMLTKLHLQVDIANNGQEALDALRQRPYDLIFMDCQMPEMDGFEATQKIRQAERERETLLNAGGGEKEPQPSLFSLTDSHRSHVPIIALTANALPSDRSRCLEAGMDDFLSKPVS
ncbi:MAG: response regulator, partial [Nitrospira sp.]|nr:response regulator [Nitrospira sp.]